MLSVVLESLARWEDDGRGRTEEGMSYLVRKDARRVDAVEFRIDSVASAKLKGALRSYYTKPNRRRYVRGGLCV